MIKNKTQILFIDEMFSNMDSSKICHIQNIMKIIQKHYNIVCFITHVNDIKNSIQYDKAINIKITDNGSLCVLE